MNLNATCYSAHLTKFTRSKELHGTSLLVLKHKHKSKFVINYQRMWYTMVIQKVKLVLISHRINAPASATAHNSGPPTLHFSLAQPGNRYWWLPNWCTVVWLWDESQHSSTHKFKLCSYCPISSKYKNWCNLFTDILLKFTIMWYKIKWFKIVDQMKLKPKKVYYLKNSQIRNLATPIGKFICS